MVRLLTLDGYVTLALEPSRTRDVFGRLLAHVRLPDGRDLGEVLLDSGLARGVERWPHRYLGRYARAEASARLEGRGRWATADADQ